jgi:hypothetical protein
VGWVWRCGLGAVHLPGGAVGQALVWPLFVVVVEKGAAWQALPDSGTAARSGRRWNATRSRHGSRRLPSRPRRSAPPGGCGSHRASIGGMGTRQAPARTGRSGNSPRLCLVITWGGTCGIDGTGVPGGGDRVLELAGALSGNGGQIGSRRHHGAGAGMQVLLFHSTYALQKRPFNKELPPRPSARTAARRRIGWGAVRPCVRKE